MVGYDKLGEFLKEKRLEQDLSQVALAKKLRNVHVQFVSNWERGTCVPPSHCMQDLITILKIDKAALVKVMLEDYRLDIQQKIYKRKAKK